MHGVQNFFYPLGMTNDLAELGVRALEVQTAVAGGNDAAALGWVQAASLVKGV